MSPDPNDKGSIYEKRQLRSIPAPLEVDSDSDFAQDIILPVVPSKRKSKEGGLYSPVKKGRSRRDILGIPSSSSGRKTTKKQRYVPLNHGPNPLQEYFGKELDLQSASEGEASVDEDPFPDEDIDPEDESDSPPILSSQTRFSQEPVGKALPSVPAGPSLGNEADSATESETEDDEDNNSSKRKLPFTPSFYIPNKRQKTEDASDSATESDSEADAEMPVFSQTHAPPRSSPAAETDSDTESDSEAEPFLDLELHPRPGFPLGPGQKLLGPLVLDAAKGIRVPGAINTYLREYQREGIRFFCDRYNEGRGGLLGDDMGLGKTIQVIAFLSAIMKKEGVATDTGRRKKHVSDLQDGKAWRKRRELPPANATWPTCLIVAPSTVVHNWEREFETWGYFEVGLYNGTPKEREIVINDFKLGRLDIVVTTFDLARRDIDVLDTLPWSCIFVDEVHRVKNLSAKITQAYHQFTCLRRFGLTGTAIQNSYSEMWTILDWTNPGRLGTPRQWNGYVVKPLTAGQSTGASEEERAKAVSVALTLKNTLLPKFFLRRTKEIIRHQLPEKTDQVVFCPLTPTQISAYKRLLGTVAVQNLILKDRPCPCGSSESRKNCCHPFVPGDVFRYMSILIKISNHLGLILPTPNDNPEQTERNRALARVAFADGDIPKYGTAMMQAQYCGKWGILDLLLQEWRKDPTNKLLIFTKSVKLIGMLEFHLSARGYGFLKLDGSTKQSDRMPMIDKFHSDPDVFIFLISTLAGGTGLNLTGANKVVIFDPNWNPAHDLQAMDRAFRFGQTRDVSVYRLLGAGSVEELIYARQIYKQQQMAIGYEASVQTRYFEGIQGDANKKGELFGIENIFKLHEDKLATKMAIEKANLAELDWALANMGGTRSKKTKVDSALVEADAKGAKEENMRGLGALLFDDAPPSANSEQDAIQKTLNSIGVTYSHLNDEILAPSRIEEERTKTTLRRRRERKSRGGRSSTGADEQPGPQWPPKRKHHKPPPTPEELLASRHQALIELGMINHPADVPTFARDFARQSRKDQSEILAELDQWARNQKTR